MEKEKIQGLKTLVKDRALVSREVTKERLRTKLEATDRQSESYRNTMWKISSERDKARWEGRATNLAYGFLRGTPYGAMEGKVREGNYPPAHSISEILEVPVEAVVQWVQAPVQSKEAA